MRFCAFNIYKNFGLLIAPKTEFCFFRFLKQTTAVRASANWKFWNWHTLLYFTIMILLTSWAVNIKALKPRRIITQPAMQCSVQLKGLYVILMITLYKRFECPSLVLETFWNNLNTENNTFVKKIYREFRIHAHHQAIFLNEGLFLFILKIKSKFSDISHWVVLRRFMKISPVS